jgi:hypothetical protein
MLGKQAKILSIGDTSTSFGFLLPVLGTLSWAPGSPSLLMAALPPKRTPKRGGHLSDLRLRCSEIRRPASGLTAAVGAAAASKENGEAFYKPIQHKNNQRGAEAQDKRQQK